MKIFISDLHMGSPLFNKEKEILRIFNNPEVDEIFILGDILDTWEENPYKTAEKKKDFIYEINQYDKIKVMLKGNHDPEIDIMKEIFTNTVILEKHSMTLFGKETILVHGDEFDKSISWTKITFYFHYIAERMGINLKGFIRSFYSNFLLFKNGLPENSLILNAEKDLVTSYSNNFDLLICGHTHLPKLVKGELIDYANCGSMVYNPSYIVVDENYIILKRL